MDLAIHSAPSSECAVTVWFFKKLHCKYSVVTGLRVKANCWKTLVEWIVVGNSCVIGPACRSKELAVPSAAPQPLYRAKVDEFLCAFKYSVLLSGPLLGSTEDAVCQDSIASPTLSLLFCIGKTLTRLKHPINKKQKI